MRDMLHVLLVEDDLDDQEFFIEALNSIENVSLFGIANNGEEAIAILGNPGIPDLIFMDIHMPHMDGIECLSKIIQTDSIKNIPVIMLSTALHHIDKVKSLGARGFIEKPSDNRVLRSHLERMINTDYSSGTTTGLQSFTIIYCPATSLVR